jgi:DNA-binding transcriptional regulator YhcF (GntR family)
MLLRIDPSAPADLFEQIAAGLRRAIAEGEVTAGERLPPARELAGSLGVNMHTVLRAYGRLRDEGLVELRRGRGAVVRGGAHDGQARLVELAAELAHEGRRLGLSAADVTRVVKEAYQR